jgi:hypothetical protein
MGLSDSELLCRGLAGAVAGSDGAGPKGTSTTDVLDSAELRSTVSDGDVDDAVVREERNGSERSGLLSTVLGAGRDKDGRELLAQGLGGPEPASRIEECADLSRGATITSRNCTASVVGKGSSRLNSLPKAKPSNSFKSSGVMVGISVLRGGAPSLVRIWRSIFVSIWFSMSVGT